MALVRAEVRTGNIIKHMLAAEAAMRAVAVRLGADADTWALAGLLHDLDYERTKDEPARHGALAVEMLSPFNLPAGVAAAILAHNHLREPEGDVEKALVAVDPATGFVVAAALMHPAKSLAAVDVDFLLKRFKEKRFAAGASREQMSSCSSLGLGLDEFLNLVLDGMRAVSAELGL